MSKRKGVVEGEGKMWDFKLRIIKTFFFDKKKSNREMIHKRLCVLYDFTEYGLRDVAVE